MNYYILRKYINNTIELHIALPKKGITRWAFPLHIEEIVTFNEIGAQTIPRSCVINDYQDTTIVCENEKIADEAHELLESLIVSCTLVGDNRFD